MAHSLSEQEIAHRLIRLRNYERLYPILKHNYEQAKQENRALKERVCILEARDKEKDIIIETLKLQIEELQRIIFGKKKKRDHDTGDTGDDGRSLPHTPAPRNSSSYHRRIPEDREVTREETHTLDECSQCHAPFTKKKTATFYEEDVILPDEHTKFKDVTKHIVEQGYCHVCKKWRIMLPMPPTVVTIGEKTRSFIAYASIILRLSYEQIQHILSDLYAFPISQGEIRNILEHEAIKLNPAYERLKEAIRQQQGAHYDETSWPVQREEQGGYAWVMTGTESSDAVFLIGRSRGKGNAEELMGEDTAHSHIGISDDYGAYRNLFQTHQLCWAHPLRKLRDMTQSDCLSETSRKRCAVTYQQFAHLYEEVREIIACPFNQEERERVRQNLLNCLAHIAQPDPADPRKLATLKASLHKNSTSYFTCLLHQNIPADNNKAERALRHLVLKRKISFGSRTQAAANTMSILASVLLSLWWRRPQHFFAEYAALRGV